MVARDPGPLSFFSNDPAPTDIYTLSLHDALPISASASGRRDLSPRARRRLPYRPPACTPAPGRYRSEEHTSELQSLTNLVCRLLLEKKKNRRFSNHDRDESYQDGVYELVSVHPHQ